MSNAQMLELVNYYVQALNNGKITPKEFDGLIVALAQIMNDVEGE